MPADQAIPPPPHVDDPGNQIVLFYGFPFHDEEQFYRRVVNPSWVPRRTPQGVEDPNMEDALYTLREKTGYKHMSIPNVISDKLREVLCMVAVASYVPSADPHNIVKVSQQQLKEIAAAAGLESVKPRWMLSSWVKEDLLDMKEPLL